MIKIENIILKSQKINLNKIFKILWGIAIAFLIILLFLFSNGYREYQKGQETAITVSAISGVITPASYGVDDITVHDKNYKQLVEALHDKYVLDDATKHLYSSNLSEADYKKVLETYSKIDRNLGVILTEAGFECYKGSFYLKYTSLPKYISACTAFELKIIGFIVATILMLVTLWYFIDKKKELQIDGHVVICKNGNMTTKQFLIKDIKSVTFSAMKGLKIQGTGIKYKINFIANRDDIKTTIMNALAANSNESATILKDNSAESIMKYKELLDSGVISQEEFNAKKKQLLGL